ncbi:MAG: uracil-DNA glycosylase, partial [Chloroflexi bacterium]|nr:uracil-DNA glycosylase [Chloroflexota bacterium]
MDKVEAAAALAALDAEIKVCTRCRLHETATRAVPGEGPIDAPIVFIGEAPGFNEDKQGRPFVGQAGQVLEELLGIIGLKRSEVFIANVVKHRPPNNRDPMPDETTACAPFLQRQLELIRPRVVVTLGRHSMGKYFPKESISRIHGQPRRIGDLVVFPMYHPAAALH